METFFIAAAYSLPCLVYLSAGLFVAFKMRGRWDSEEQKASKVLKELVILYIVIAVCVFSGFPMALCAGNIALRTVTDSIILKLYVFSAAVPCLVIKNYLYGNKQWLCFVIPAFVICVLALMADVVVFSGQDGPAYAVLSRCSVAAVFAISCYIAYVCVIHGEDNVRICGVQFGKELFMHMLLMSFYNFLFLVYSIRHHILVDYFLTAVCFAAVHLFVILLCLRKRPMAVLVGARAGTDSVAVPRHTAAEECSAPGHGIEEEEEPVQTLKERLLNYFETEKPYLSKDLSMEEVAMRLFTNKSYLSKTINMEMNKNFRELVNYFRVREAIKIFASDTDISMRELRDRCGFNNNASFTSAFKLNTGRTPGEWCRDMKSRQVAENNKKEKI